MLDDQPNPAPRRALLIRLAIGLTQGLVLYDLNLTSDQILPVAFGALILTAWLVPIVALGAYGAARSATLLVWLALATVITAGLGAYDAYVGMRAAGSMSPSVAFFAAAALFILHHLILPADAERRWRAPFERYFDEGWKDAVRLVLAAVFVGALWVLLGLGASLFKIINLNFLRDLIQHPWFYYPVTSAFFAIAVHVTDVRVGLVRGARTLVLSLLSWLLPILTLIAAGFLLALPFTGLSVLWATHAASETMLAACAALIILLNATYQEGERAGFPPVVLRWSGRAAGLLLAPLVAMAGYGVFLRIGQHGLTPQRIYAIACVVAAAAYAAGYAWAAVSRGPWMKPIEITDWVTAQIVVAIILFVFSPLGDPAKFSVQSQVHRLEAGVVKPDAFDYSFLHFRAGRWGRAALGRLANPRTAPPGVAPYAAAELKNKYPRFRPPQTSATERAKAIQAVKTSLPAGFITQVWPAEEDPALGCSLRGRPCPAIALEIDATPGPEVVVFQPYRARVYAQRAGHWTEIGDLQGQFCGDEAQAIAKGQFRLAPPLPHNDLDVAGRRLTFVERSRCPKGQAGFYRSATIDAGLIDVPLVKPVPPPPPPKAP